VKRPSWSWDFFNFKPMVMHDGRSVTPLIKEKARELGFDLCGIAKVRPLREHAARISEWVGEGMHSNMQYLARDIEKRTNPSILLPGSRSVIVTGLNYFTNSVQGGNGVPVISRYAYGTDYHEVITARLKRLMEFINGLIPEAEGRAYSDSAPLLEKAWAREAGLGWPGKHSVIINDKIGSFFFIGILLINIELEYDKPFAEEKCGSCRLCIENCPTRAINEDRTLDTNKCIANLTIENRDPVPASIAEKLEGRVYGCDKCQEVCPWNRHASVHDVSEFKIDPELMSMTIDDWKSLQKDKFTKLFSRTPAGRKKYEVFMENVRIVTSLQQKS